MENNYQIPGYTWEDYQNELEWLKTQKVPQPSINFVIRFHERLKEDEEVMDEVGLDNFRDSVDYFKWGYALTGEWVQAEDLPRQLNIWQFHAIYENSLRDLLNQNLDWVTDVQDTIHLLYERIEG